MQTHRIVKLDEEKGLLTVESVLPKSEYEKGGSKYGYAYRWNAGKYFFLTNSKETIMRDFALTSDEYDELKPKVTY